MMFEPLPVTWQSEARSLHEKHEESNTKLPCLIDVTYHHCMVVVVVVIMLLLVVMVRCCVGCCHRRLVVWQVHLVRV